MTENVRKDFFVQIQEDSEIPARLATVLESAIDAAVHAYFEIHFTLIFQQSTQIQLTRKAIKLS